MNGTRRPEIIDVIHALFIPQERPEELTVVTPTPPTIIVEGSVPPPHSPHVTEEVPLYPTVQSMRGYVFDNGPHLTSFENVLPNFRSFYFDPPADFGEWRILLGSRTQSDLRNWQRRDNNIFLIIMKKLQYVT